MKLLKTSLVLAALTTAVLLTACGGQKQPDESNKTDPSSVVAAQSEETQTGSGASRTEESEASETESDLEKEGILTSSHDQSERYDSGRRQSASARNTSENKQPDTGSAGIKESGRGDEPVIISPDYRMDFPAQDSTGSNQPDSDPEYEVIVPPSDMNPKEPEGTAPEEAVPDDSASGESGSDHTASDEPGSDHSAPDESVPDKSEDGKSDSDEQIPGQPEAPAEDGVIELPFVPAF